MGLIDRLKRNIFFQNAGAKLLHTSIVKKKNVFFHACDQLNFIGKDIEKLSILIQNYYENIPKNRVFISNRIYGESMHYGHLHALVKYANIPNHLKIYLPIIEHGVHFDGYKNSTGNLSKIEEGNYGKAYLHQEYPGTPLFSIGPYIHYAEQFYSDSQIHELKQKLGRVLLVFPSHSHELAAKEYNKDDFLEQVSVIGKNFDSVLFCAYWNDLRNEFFQQLLNEKKCVVSAGFRGSQSFINKLKTIITLSDEVVVNDLTSGIGYFIYMKKRLHFINSNVTTISHPDEKCLNLGNNLFPQFCKMFKNMQADLTASQLNFIEPFWGFTKIKTPEEILRILQINRRIIIQARGNRFLLEKSARAELERLRNSNLKAEHKDYILLKDAIE